MNPKQSEFLQIHGHWEINIGDFCDFVSHISKTRWPIAQTAGMSSAVVLSSAIIAECLLSTLLTILREELLMRENSISAQIVVKY